MKRGAIIGLIAGAAVIVVGAGATWWLTSRPESAEHAAQRYVTALEDGDRGTLAALLADDRHRDALLDAFAGATGRISEATLAAPTGHAGLRDFRADVTVGGAPGVVLFSMSDASGGWRLAGDYLATVDVATSIGDAVEVGSTTVPTGSMSLLPASYTVRAVPAGLLTGETVVVVTNEKPVRVQLEASLSPAATDAAQTQLDAYARACAAPATAVPAHCGLRVPWGADLTSLQSLRFRIEKSPRVVLTTDAAGFAATGGVIVATAHGVARSGGDGTFTYRADDWSLYGSVSFQGDRMVLAVR